MRLSLGLRKKQVWVSRQHCKFCSAAEIIFISMGICFLAAALYVLFASPKKNQKKSPAKDYIPIAGGSLIELWCYCASAFIVRKARYSQANELQ